MTSTSAEESAASPTTSAAAAATASSTAGKLASIVSQHILIFVLRAVLIPVDLTRKHLRNHLNVCLDDPGRPFTRATYARVI